MNEHRTPESQEQTEIATQLQQGVEALRMLEEEQHIFVTEFAAEKKLTAMVQGTNDVGGSPGTFLSLEPPALWFQTRMDVVCLWRSLQHNTFFAFCWESWARCKAKYMWTGVSDRDVLNFLNALMAMALQALSNRKYARGMSTESWETVRKTFKVISLWNGDFWSGLTDVCYADLDMCHAWIPAPQRSALCDGQRNPAVCILPTVRWDDPTPTLSHDTIEKVLRCVLHGQEFTTDALLFTQKGTDAERLAELLSVSGGLHRVASGVKIPQAFQFIPKTVRGANTATWWYTCQRYDPYLPHRMNMVWGPLLRKHGGHLHTPSLHLEQHVYDSMHHQKVYFNSIRERETAARREALRARWDMKLRRVKTNFQWGDVPRSLDTVNAALQFATQPTPRKISALRRTRASVHGPGTWIYIVWSRKSSNLLKGICRPDRGEGMYAYSF